MEHGSYTQIDEGQDTDDMVKVEVRESPSTKFRWNLRPNLSGWMKYIERPLSKLLYISSLYTSTWPYVMIR
jgi:hypothetical protein